MMNHTCPTCGHTSKARASKPRGIALPERADIDALFLSKAMTQPAYYEACKRIARRDDLRFLIRVAGPDLTGALLDEAQTLLLALETRKATGADANQINSIRDRYRVAKGSLIIYAGSLASTARSMFMASAEAA